MSPAPRPIVPARQRPGTAQRHSAHGMSLVELMVGITIGLFILAAASLVATSQLGDNRRLLLEAQVQQDVRITADLITRDLGRAGYWGNAHWAVWPTNVVAALGNPYRAITPVNNAAANSVTFSRSLDEEGGAIIAPEDNIVDASESGGFRHNVDAQTIEMRLSDGNWQTLTDPAVLRITRFAVRMTTTTTPVPCGVSCPAVGPGGCQFRQLQRNATVEIEGSATTDPNVRRSVSSDVRLRNDLVECV